MNRAYSEIGSNSKMKLAAALLLTLPGNPFIYYGEEIGMKGQNQMNILESHSNGMRHGKRTDKLGDEPLQ